MTYTDMVSLNRSQQLKPAEGYCKKASQKLHSLARTPSYMDPEKLQHLTRAVVLSQLSYCPLVWIFYDRGLNHRINHIHEKALRIAYKDCKNHFGFS